MPLKLGTNLAADGFKKSPIVFGALPSLHGAMALQCGLWFYYQYGANISCSSTRKSKSIRGLSSDLSHSEFVNDDLGFNKDESIELLETGESNTVSEQPFSAAQSSKWWWNTGRVIVSFYMLLQWYSTMYLDHHYRIDLFVGGVYAIISFNIVRIFVMEKNYDTYLQIAESGDSESIKMLDLSSKVWWFSEYGVLSRYRLKQLQPTGDREEMSIGERVFEKYEFSKIFKI